MTDITFGKTTVDIPKTTITRAKAPNPFDGRFPSDDAALPVSLTAPTQQDAAKAAQRLIVQARKAANKVDRTSRASKPVVTSAGAGKNKIWTAEFVVWTVKRQTRKAS